MAELLSFKRDCVLNAYKRADGSLKYCSLLHRPTGLRVEDSIMGIESEYQMRERMFSRLFSLVSDLKLRKRFCVKQKAV